MYESMRNGFVEPKLFIPAPGSAPAYLPMNMISFQKIKCIFVYKKYRFNQQGYDFNRFYVSAR